MDPSDSSQSRKRTPAVSEVVAELTKRLLATPEQQPALFHAAQQACAEELRLVKTGFRAAPFDELVERAIRLLPSEMAQHGSPHWPSKEAFPEAEPFADAGVPVPAALARPGDGPFAFESDETPASPGRAAGEPVRPLQIPDTPPPPASATPAPHRRSHRESPRERSGRSITAIRLVIFALLGGAGFAAYRFARTNRWPFRRPAASGAARPAPSAARASTSAPAPSPASASATFSSSTAPSTSSSTASPRLPGRQEALKLRASVPVERKAGPEQPSAAAAGGLPESRGSSMISSDWDGRAPVYMIHFSSYQKRENAERDQARLAKLVGRPFHIVSVNLGREGSWFRVMLGDFPSRDEALAFRQQLADRKTPGMGLVYKVSGTR